MAKEKVKKPFYKKWWVWLLAVIIIGSIASGGEEETASTDTDTKAETASTEPAKEEAKADAPKEEPKKEEKKVFAIGDVVKVGNFEYVIKSASETTKLESGNQFVDDVTTEGKLVVIEYSVKNLDKEARYVDANLFQLKGNGAEFEPMNKAEVMMILGDANLFLEEVNPQMSRTGKFVVEVPADMASYNLEVSSGLGWSGGETEQIKLK